MRTLENHLSISEPTNQRKDETRLQIKYKKYILTGLQTKYV